MKDNFYTLKGGKKKLVNENLLTINHIHEKGEKLYIFRKTSDQSGKTREILDLYRKRSWILGREIHSSLNYGDRGSKLPPHPRIEVTRETRLNVLIEYSISMFKEKGDLFRLTDCVS